MDELAYCNEDRSSLPVEEWKGREGEIKRLLLCSNRISTLSNSLLVLQNLEFLDISGNQLYQIPSHLSRLPQLQSLLLGQNSISLLTIPKMPQLTCLDLSHNRIHTISDRSFSCLPQLEILNLAHNSIRFVPSASVTSLTCLQSLYLNHNLLTEVPTGIFSLSSLRFLNVQENQILKLEGAPVSRKDFVIQIDGNPIVKQLLTASPEPSSIKKRANTFESSISRLRPVSTQKSSGSPRKKRKRDQAVHKESFEAEQIQLRQRVLFGSRGNRPRTLSCSYAMDLEEGASILGDHALLSPGLHKSSLSNEMDENCGDPVGTKDQHREVKKLKKRLNYEQKQKAEAIELLQVSLRSLKNRKASEDNYQSVIHHIEQSIMLLSSKKKEKGRPRLSKRLTSSLPSINTEPTRPRSSRPSKLGSSITFEDKDTKGDASDGEQTDPETDVRTKPKKRSSSKRLSVMRRGNTLQNCQIKKVEKDLELAFTTETVDGEEEKTLVGGNIISIFRYLIYHDRSTENLSSFLCMYRNFVDSKTMVAELRSVVKKWSENKGEDLHSDATYQQICRIVQQWIEHYMRLDFWHDAALLEKILEVISILPNIASFRLQKLLEFKLSECAEQEQRKPKRQESVPTIERHAVIDLMSINPLDVAQQLTLLEFEMLQEIDPVQCISSSSRKASTGIQKLIERFNIVSRWVATEIVMESTLKKRANVVKFFIDVADAAYEMGNYNSVLEITAGLTLSPVSRLTKTWEAIPKKTKEIFDSKHLKLMDGHHNFANYRQVLQSANLPCLPYFGIFLRDLTFIDDSLDNTLDNGFANFHKMKKMGTIVQSIIHYQSTPFKLPVQGHLYNFLKNVAPLKEDTLYNKSTICEPPSELWNI